MDGQELIERRMKGMCVVEGCWRKAAQGFDGLPQLKCDVHNAMRTSQPRFDAKKERERGLDNLDRILAASRAADRPAGGNDGGDSGSGGRVR